MMSDENSESINDNHEVGETSLNSSQAPVRLIISNQSTLPNSSTPNQIFRTAERSSFFPNGVPTNLDEIRPIIAQAYSSPMALTSWLNMTLPRYQLPSSDSFVLNIDDPPTTASSQSSTETATTTATTTTITNGIVSQNHLNVPTTDNFLNNIIEVSSSGSNDNTNNTNSSSSNNINEDGSPLEIINTDTNAFLRTVENHWPFAAIMIIKFATDNHSGTLRFFEFIILLFVFIKMNNDLKREIFKQQNSSCKKLLHILIYNICALIIIYFIPNRGPIFYINEKTSFWNLLWSVIVTDFILKLFTILLKTLLTFLPIEILLISKRGKYYLAIEAVSQFIRSIAPMYSWMIYLMNSVPETDIWSGYVLMILYGACKMRELSRKWKYLQSSLVKFCQNVSLGTNPSKEQLTASGGVCVICHEEFSSPVRLHCKHIFCENCVSTWLDREKTCPLCRTAIIDDPTYRDGDTTHCLQVY